MTECTYCYYAWSNQLTVKETFFVAPLKSLARNHVVSRRAVLIDDGSTRDQTIKTTDVATATKCPIQIHCISFRNAETNKHYLISSNNFKASAQTLAKSTRRGGKLNDQFRCTKQNLKIKTEEKVSNRL